MSILTRKEILEYMKKDTIDERLIVTPVFNEDEQIKEGGIDIRLGFQFITTKRSEFKSLDPKESNTLKNNVVRYQRLTRVGFKEPFVLHPDELVLGATLEYISLPNTLTGYVLSRSSWGRLGLIIATATYVHACFKGCLTLELLNLGEVPLVLYPGLRIAQLVLHSTAGAEKYEGTYDCPTGPEFSKVYNDPDLVKWTPDK